MGPAVAECQLCLSIMVDEAAERRLAAALAAAPIASVTLAAPGGMELTAQGVLPLVQLAQAKNVAVLIENDAALARIVKADGVHLAMPKSTMEAYAMAREVLGSRAIVGIWPGKSRHDAMVAAEAGADYIAFGVPDGLQDPDAGRQRRNELIAWWAEVFEIPGMALGVEDAQEAAELAGLGAEFVAMPIVAGATIADTTENVAAMATALERREEGN